MRGRPRIQAGPSVAVILFLLSTVLPVRVEAQATYQGKSLTAWLDAMRHDLDPEYRRAAADAVTHFGALAIPRLSQMLNRGDDAESVRLAAIVLIRIGPSGRALVADRLTKEPKRSLIPVIDGISQSGPWARAFVPHLRTLVNSPAVSLIALRTLAQVEATPDPAVPDALVELQREGPAGTLFMKPFDCFVKDRFSSIRAAALLSDGVKVVDVGMKFRSALEDDVYWTPAKRLGKDAAGRDQYEALFPKIATLGLTTVSYAILVETSAGDLISDEVPAAISPSDEGCLMVGAQPAPEPAANSVTGIEVTVFSKRRRREPR